ncbi:hypothetical protein HPP92_021860 [Vanilla planifolia]|uniref:DUF7796 domain-containing protein n=1 Tax=Vanilla planifolia TaxID=51239 RepID=A0A835PR11_VANPL|nr:hypothetical protein HPP92_022192 [Vanilla planifolia]KAG0458732.1 hypothetical protein HPP92_021860 [Vanilla planifolia]
MKINDDQTRYNITEEACQISNFKTSRIFFLCLIYILLCAVITNVIHVNVFHPVSYISSTMRSSSSHHPSISASSSCDSTIVKATKMAICLVGGARRFELTGPSIVKHVLQEYPNADLFLHGPLDQNAYKFFLLKTAPRIAAVRIFDPHRIAETKMQLRVLSSGDSPNGTQGLLQYFNLVEGCLGLISAHESRHNFTYEWIVRTRVDGYWSAPLDTSAFQLNGYLVPAGSRFGGLNDRLGIGDRATSAVALSRLSVLPVLAAIGHQNLNSESAFKAQLAATHVRAKEATLPFCILSDRHYMYPPGRFGVPVAAIDGGGRLSGAKCRPCEAVCTGKCVEKVWRLLNKGWGWLERSEGSLGLCNATGPWEEGWERVFDRAAGEKAAAERRKVEAVDLAGCQRELEGLKKKANLWDAPAPAEICRLGLVDSVL